MVVNTLEGPHPSPQNSESQEPSEARLETWILLDKRGLLGVLLDSSAYCLNRSQTAGDVSMDWEDTAEMIEDILPFIVREPKS